MLGHINRHINTHKNIFPLNSVADFAFQKDELQPLCLVLDFKTVCRGAKAASSGRGFFRNKIFYQETAVDKGKLKIT